MSKKNGQHFYSPQREPEQRQTERPRCNIKPECEGCPYPGHGFICWSADGSCLRTWNRRKKGGAPHEA